MINAEDIKNRMESPPIPSSRPPQAIGLQTSPSYSYFISRRNKLNDARYHASAEMQLGKRPMRSYRHACSQHVPDGYAINKSYLKAENIPPHFTKPVDKAMDHLYSSSLTFIPRISASVPIAFDKCVRLVCMCNVVGAGGCNTERNWNQQVLNF